MSKERRLSRIFAKDGKSVTLALDGYYFSTKTNGIDNTINQLPALVEHGLGLRARHVRHVEELSGSIEQRSRCVTRRQHGQYL